MKKFSAILLAAMMILSLAACGGKTEPETQTSTNAPQISSENTESTEATEENSEETSAPEEDAEETTMPEGDPAEYGREFWEEKYPGENICPFYIDENGTEYSYYWVSALEGWDGTMASWIEQPFNWNGWHVTDDGCIVNADETLKITDDWANGDESMSSYCTVTTETYVKDAAVAESTTVSED